MLRFLIVLALAILGGSALIFLNDPAPERPRVIGYKYLNPPPPGVIGSESRIPLADFTPDANQFPGWEDVTSAVVRVSCNGTTVGGGVLVGEGDMMLTAAHVFRENNGQLRQSRDTCYAVNPDGDEVEIDTSGIFGGAFFVPEALASHFSVPVTMQDWAVVPLARIPEGAHVLPVASPRELALDPDTPVLNIVGPTLNREGEDFYAQVCRYAGPPPTASALDDTGQIYGRPLQESDVVRVARYDCDSGRGASGSPIIGWHNNQPVIWGIITDSLRGRPRCLDVGRTNCYTAGPLVPVMVGLPQQ